MAQGQLDDALAAYRAARDIHARLAAADPSNAAWQRDVFVSYAKLGSVLEQAGDLAGAAEHYGEATESTAEAAKRTKGRTRT